MIEVIPASLKSSSSVILLIRQLWDSSQKSDTEISMLVDRVFSTRSDRVFVAQIGERTVGVVVFSIFESGWLGGPIAYVHALVVDSEYRGKGCGGKLLSEVASYSKNLGALGIELDSGFARESAHEFYEKQGFKKVSFLFSKRI